MAPLQTVSILISLDMTLYDISKGKGNYYEAKGVVRRKYKNEWYDSFRGYVRFAGDCTLKLKNLSNGAVIKLVRIDVERIIEKQDANSYEIYEHFLIFEFDIRYKSLDECRQAREKINNSIK